MPKTVPFWAAGLSPPTRAAATIAIESEVPRLHVRRSTTSDAASASTSRALRAAGWIIAGTGALLLVLVIGYAALAILIVASSPGSHEAGGAGMLAIVLVPAALGGLVSVWIGWRVRRGGPGGRLAGLSWAALMGCVCVVAASGDMNLLSAVRVLAAGGAVSVVQGGIVMTMPGEAGYYGYFSDPAFWATGIIGLATVVVLSLMAFGRESPAVQ
jgi:hypothetical protein